jgi:thiamine biosynthesis lipoprotein
MNDAVSNDAVSNDAMSNDDDALPSITWRDWSCSVCVTVTEREHRDAAAQIVRSLMDEVDRAVSRFRPDSEIERANNHAGVIIPVSTLTAHLVGVAIDAARDTKGAVDPTLGGELIGVGYDRDIDSLRRGSASSSTNSFDETAVPSARRAQPWRRVVVDRVLQRVGVPDGVRLDLGATAKAWTADEAARRINARLGSAALVSIGGDVAVAGDPESPWQIDVSELQGVDPVRITLHHGGLATSSTVGRRWTRSDGGMAHHLLDPRTGEPVSGPWRTASVWAPSALRANVLSTWALVDAGAALRHIRELDLAARLVSCEGEVFACGNWPRHLAAGPVQQPGMTTTQTGKKVA